MTSIPLDLGACIACECEVCNGCDSWATHSAPYETDKSDPTIFPMFHANATIALCDRCDNCASR